MMLSSSLLKFAASVEVTLLATHAALALTLEQRLAGTGVRVVDLGLGPPTAWQRRRERLSPGYAARRLRTAIRRGLPRLGHYDAAHANHPALAAALRPLADRVVVAAWFYPHAPIGRAVATWEHTGRRFPRSAGLAVKGFLHYRNDVRGYRVADCAVAPTLVLTEQLRRAGIPAVHSPPPCRPPVCSSAAEIWPTRASTSPWRSSRSVCSPPGGGRSPWTWSAATRSDSMPPWTASRTEWR